MYLLTTAVTQFTLIPHVTNWGVMRNNKRENFSYLLERETNIHEAPHLCRQHMFTEFFSCICIGFLEFDKPAMCKISHSHFFSIMSFVLPFQTEHSTYFILSKVCHFVGGLKHKCIICLQMKFYATI